jgi:aspartyl-tRNA(Asn)/glutamyl-tRNA(Gln) amidotransferase subunit A
MGAVDFARAGQYRLEYGERMLAKLAAERIDLVATPAQAQTPPPIGARTIPYAGDPAMDVTYAMCGLTVIFNMLGWPAVSVPCGTDSLGLPVGIQLAALPWREDHCLAAALAVEAAAL